jgi:hypothetical protein
MLSFPNAIMRVQRLATRNRLGALLTLVTGIGVASAGWSYRIGTLKAMGAGFMPVVLGALLCLIGMALLVTDTGANPAKESHSASVDMRGAVCILLGIGGFVILGDFLGLVPASFVSVFLSALGDRKNSVRDALYLAIAAMLVGVCVFHYGLHLQLPLFSRG